LQRTNSAVISWMLASHHPRASDDERAGIPYIYRIGTVLQMQQMADATMMILTTVVCIDYDTSTKGSSSSSRGANACDGGGCLWICFVTKRV
jgi:hypothetical protein